MTYYQIFATGLRVLALWLGLTTVSYLVALPITTDPHLKPDMEMLVTYLAPGSLLAVAVLLWLFPQAVASKLIPRTRYDNQLKLNLHEVARACAALVGLWIFTRALPHVLWYVTFFSFNTGDTSAFSTLDTWEKTSFILACFDLLLALVLMVRSADFARLLVPKVKA